MRKFIKVGAIMPLTCPSGPWGVGLRNAMIIGAEHINAGDGVSIAGETYYLRVYPEDDEYKAAFGLTKNLPVNSSSFSKSDNCGSHM